VFRVKFELLKIPVKVRGKCRVQSEGTDYYCMTITEPGNSRIEILTDYCDCRIFGSFSYSRPCMEIHDSSSGLLYMPNNVIEVDPFPSCPLEFVPAISFNETHKENTNRVRLCIDSQSKSSIFYFSLVNSSESVCEIEITANEFSDEELAVGEDLEKLKTFKSVFSAIDSQNLSHKDRESLGLTYNLEFTYGEVEFLSYAKMLSFVEPGPGEVFWDLGSGVGKSLVAAGLAYPFLRIRGIEYLPTLYEVCRTVCEQFHTIQTVHGDIRNIDWQDADIVYMSSVCFLDSLLEDIKAKTKELKVGAKILTLREFPECSTLELKSVFRLKMSWGRSDCYYYIKIE
jgi:hypothetical protein